MTTGVRIGLTFAMKSYDINSAFFYFPSAFKRLSCVIFEAVVVEVFSLREICLDSLCTATRSSQRKLLGESNRHLYRLHL